MTEEARGDPIRHLLAACLLALIAGAPAAADAEVVAFEVTATQPYGVFSPGPYVRIEGRVRGELDVSEPIPDLEEADTDGDGKLSYATDLVLIAPSEAAAGNGTLIVDLENRGRPIAHTLYNSPYGAPLQPGSTAPGSGFLQDHGFLLAIPSWELGHGVELPSFTDRTGQTRYAEGVGFAVVRDIGAWLKGIEGEAANPLGDAAERTIAAGSSQTGRLLKSFLLHGFNARDGARVFDGMHLQAPHAGLLPLVRSGPGPQSVANTFPTFQAPDLRRARAAVHLRRDHGQGWHARRAAAEADRHQRDERLLQSARLARPHRARGYRRSAAARRGPRVRRRRRRARLPARHAGLRARPRHARLEPDHAGRAAAPRPLAARRHAAARHHADAADNGHPRLRCSGSADLGTESRGPGTCARCRRQREGRGPPAGDRGGQNGPLDDVLCTLSGAFVPFARTKAEREAADDSRLSLEERYPSRDTYVRRVGTAVLDAIEAGFLLPEDGVAMTEAAARNPLFR